MADLADHIDGIATPFPPGSRVTSDDVTRVDRSWKTARSWFRRAVWQLRFVSEAAPNDSVRWLASYYSSRLLDDVVHEAELLVDLLDDDEVAEAEERVKQLASRLRKRRLAARLADTAGRTAEEAAAFRAKAEALRS